MCRRSLLAVCVIAALVVAAGAGASDSRSDLSFGLWTATFSGTFDYEWSEPIQEPCYPNGSGSVRVRFSDRFDEPFEISFVRDGAFRAFGLINNTTRVSGRVTVTDDRKRNPPPPNSYLCDPDPIDKSGCGTRRFDHGMFSLDSTDNNDAVHRPALQLRLTVDFSWPEAFPYRECYTAGMQDFGYFPGNSPQDSDTRDWGERLGFLMGPRLHGDDFASRRAFTVKAQDTHRGHEGPGTHTGRRSVTITFTPVSDELRLEQVAAAPITVPHHGGLAVMLLPPGSTATSFTWEMKRSGQSQWTTLGVTTAPRIRFSFEAAGHFVTRTTANGARPPGGGIPRRLVSGGRLEVGFPTWSEIARNQAVQSFTQELWRITLNLATPVARQEVGFWIALDTCSGRYNHTTTILGPITKPDETAEVTLGRRPSDIPNSLDPVKGCSTYMVAAFHTHTPTTYRTPGNTRRVGPSAADEEFATSNKVPGGVFDYIESPAGSKSIPAGYPKESPAQFYLSGLRRRPTPQ